MKILARLGYSSFLTRPTRSSKADQSCDIMNVEAVHELGPVRFDCLDADLQKAAISLVDFPRAISCSVSRWRGAQQLQRTCLTSDRAGHSSK